MRVRRRLRPCAGRQRLGARRPAGDQRELERRLGVCAVAFGPNGRAISATDGSGVGVCCPRRDDNALPHRRDHVDGSGELRRQPRLRRRAQGRLQEADDASGHIRREPVGAARCSRQRVGVDRGLLERQLHGSAGGRWGLGDGGLRVARGSGWFLDQQAEAAAIRKPLQVHRWQKERHPWFPSGEDARRAGGVDARQPNAAMAH